jgi:hypothetical protein
MRDSNVDKRNTLAVSLLNIGSVFIRQYIFKLSNLKIVNKYLALGTGSSIVFNEMLILCYFRGHISTSINASGHHLLD